MATAARCEHRLILGPHEVHDLDCEVSDDQSRQFLQPDQVGNSNAAQSENAGSEGSGNHRHLAGCEGTMPLLWMPTVCFDVQDVVGQVGRGRRGDEAQQRDQTRPERLWFQQYSTGQWCCEDQQVLDPLTGTCCTHEPRDESSCHQLPTSTVISRRPLERPIDRVALVGEDPSIETCGSLDALVERAGVMVRLQAQVGGIHILKPAGEDLSGGRYWTPS